MSVNEVLKAHDSEIVFNAVKRVTAEDLEELTGDINRTIEARLLPNAVKLQWQMINALVRTIVHLEKQNVMMAQDYKRGKN